MRWLTKVWGGRGPTDYRNLPGDPPESTKAKQRAIDDLKRSRDRAPEVRRVALSLREIRERNHFADQLVLLFEGRSER